MKALRDFQRRQFGMPPTLLGTHYNRIEHRLRKNNSTITQLTQLEHEHAPIEVRGDDFAECDVEIQSESVESEETVPLTGFRKGDLIAFRRSDEYCFNIIELTNYIDFKKMTFRSKVKRNILIFHSEDEEDVVIFQREDQWKGGEEMVQVNAARFATEKGIFFAVDKAGFEEIRQTALAFECFVVHEYEKSKTLERKETSNQVVKMKYNKNLFLTQLSM